MQHSGYCLARMQLTWLHHRQLLPMYAPMLCEQRQRGIQHSSAEVYEGNHLQYVTCATLMPSVAWMLSQHWPGHGSTGQNAACVARLGTPYSQQTSCKLLLLTRSVTALGFRFQGHRCRVAGPGVTRKAPCDMKEWSPVGQHTLAQSLFCSSRKSL
jgi:hypothetical protein